jgi:hypothetical protein
MKLDAKKGLDGMYDPFVGQIIGIEEQRLPQIWKSVRVNRVPVILGSNIAASRSQIYAWLVHSTVSILELVGFGTAGQGKKLVPKADTKNGAGNFEVESILDGLDSIRAHGGVTRSIGKKETLPFNLAGIGF